MSSRVIVKNIPKYIEDSRLRIHFGVCGEVTDVKIVRKPDGQSRRFAFVGYKTEQEAQKALKHFQNSFMDTCKISLELALPSGHKELPRPWSKYSEGSSAFSQSQKGNQEKEKKKFEKENRKSEKDKKDVQVIPTTVVKEIETTQKLVQKLYEEPELKEFLQIMKPRSQTKKWANDDIMESDKQMKVDAQVTAVKSKKAGGDGVFLTKTHVKFHDSDDEYEEVPHVQPTKVTEEKETELPEEDETSNLAKDTTISDADYFRSKMTFVDTEDDKKQDLDGQQSDNEEDEDIEEEDDEVKEEEEDDEIEEDEVDENNESDEIQTKNEDNVEDNKKEMELQEDDDNVMEEIKKNEEEGDANILDTGRLFVRNLPYTCTEEDLTKLFQPFGPISEVHIPIDKQSKKIKGFAYVLFLMPEHALKAYMDLDQTIFQGRLLHLMPSKPKTETSSNEPTTFKGKQDQQRKKKASEEFNWNTLFMSSDAVAEAMGAELGVGKSGILDREREGTGSEDGKGLSMATSLALAETHVITQTKQFLQTHGVKISAFADNLKKERSKTTILVKNIPYTTTETELHHLFSPHGSLSRILLPPTKTIALVEFTEPSEARNAFRFLAYTKFKHLPLYLEWAPIDVFTEKPTPAPSKNEELTSSRLDPNPEEIDNVGCTIFVKNLNFSTTTDGIRQTFEAVGPLRSVTLATKAHPKSPNEKLSMGYGFVEFMKKEDAQKALLTLQNFSLDGHNLQLKLSQRQTAQSSTKKNYSNNVVKPTGTKLVIRNVPFEANAKELRQLCGTFGQLKSLRIPKKFDGTHRGFAFVDFLTKKEAQNAFESLHSTHLYGRHLVLEWAEDDDSIDAIRDKTKRTQKALNNYQTKKRKFEVQESSLEDQEN